MASSPASTMVVHLSWMPRRSSRSYRTGSTPDTAHGARHTARHSDLVLLPLRRQTLTGMTADAIRERVLRGHYAEGSPLRQDAIASELGVSRIPVRDGVRTFFVASDEIDWVEAAGNYAILHVGKTTHILRETMSALEAQLPAFRFVPALSEEANGWSGETGLITDVVDRLEGELAEADAYVCGPPPMVEAAIALLEARGVPESHIYFDKFTTTADA